MDTQMKMNGDKVRALREEKAWSQEHLAAAAGVSVRTVQRVESDGVGSAETRLALASALGISVSELTPPTAATGVLNGSGTRQGGFGARLGLSLGALGAFAAVGASYYSGHIGPAEFSRQLGTISAGLGASVGMIAALKGWLSARPPAA